MFCIFLKYPLTGCGIGNSGEYMYQQFLNSPVSLTPEIVTKSVTLVNFGYTPFFNKGSYCTLLAEHGIFVFILMMAFYICTYYKISKLLAIPSTFNKFDYLLLKTFKLTIVAICINYFYNLYHISQYVNFIIALMVALLYRIFIQKRKELQC